MISARLIEDQKLQSYLKDETKFMVEETLTTVMEIIMGKRADLWEPAELEKLNKYRSFPNSDFIYRRSTDGRYLVEYCDAVNLLKEFFAASPYGSDFKNRIVEEQKENDEFVDKKFRNEFDKQCEKERKILEILGDSRNKDFVHAIERANMGDIYMWIRQMMKYLDCFSGYRMQVLSEYDCRYGREEDKAKLDECYTKASELKEQCFASKENYKEFRFGKNTYKVAKDDKDDFALLIPDMARSWDRGISYLKKERTSNLFRDILEEYFDDYDMVMDFDDKFGEFVKTKDKSVEESVLYMSLLYQIYPKLQGIYWKGIMYSESYFASLVLQVLTRHPNKFSLEDKRDTLKYRISNLVQWNEISENQKGIGIDLILLCKEHILTKYFEGQNDFEGVSYAKKFESIILECKDDMFIELNYDEVILAILTLTAHMKGRVTYMLPIESKDVKEGKSPYKTFKKPEEFRKYFIRFISEAEDIGEVARFVHCVKDDNNLKWFFENYDSFSGKES